MKQFSLKYRIALTMFALTGVMLAVLLWQAQRLQDDAVSTAQASDEGVVMDVLGELSRFSLIKSEYSDLEHHFSMVRRNPHVVKIIVADAADRIVMSTDIGLLGLALPVLKDSEATRWRTRKLTNAAGAQGLLAVEFSNTELLAARKRTRTWAGFVALVSMSLIALVSVIMGAALTRRLAVLTRASKRIGDGDLSTRIDLPGSDEVSELGRTVDTMAQKIEAALDALHGSREQYRLLLDTIPHGIQENDTSGIITFSNRAHHRILGYREGELVGQAIWDFQPSLADKEMLRSYLADLVRDQPPPTPYLTRSVTKDGRIIDLQVDWDYRKDAASKVTGFISVITDLTERKRAEEKVRNLNRVYVVLSNINQAIVRIRDQRMMFQEACRIAVEDGGFRMAWIGLLDGQSGVVTPTAIAGLDDGYVENLMITLNNESRGRGPTGSAVREGRHSVCNDIEHDERMAPWREDALRRGYRSSAAFPLVASGKVRGSFSLYAGAPDFFNEREMKLLDELALDISYAMEFAEQESRRSRAESDLRAAEAKYRILVEQIPAITYVASPGPDSMNLYISPQVESILGFTIEEWKADPGLWLRQLHHQDRERVLRDMESSEARGETFRCEYRLLARDGRVVWIRDEAVLLRDDNGSPQALQGVMYDITERKRVEEEQQKLISLVETSTDMIGIATLDGEVTYLNNARKNLVGIDSLEEVRRTRISDYIVPEDMNLLHEEILPAVQKTGRWTGEIRFRHWKTGEAVPVELTGFMIFDRETDRPLAMASISRDVSERKRTEEALRHSEEQYRLVVENASDAIFIAQDGMLKFPNAALVKLLGYDRDELTTRPFANFIYPDDRQMVLDRHTMHLHGQDAPLMYEFRVASRAGTVRWVELSAVKIEWEGRPATLNFLRDITQQKKLEQQFRHAQKMEAVGQLAGGIAHDFNNILTAIVGYGNLALMKLPEGDPVRATVNQILLSADRAALLTKSLLAFSRKQVINAQPVAVNAIISRVGNLLHRVIGEDIELRTLLAERELTVLADSGQIEQVLVNLATNARDAMPRGGRFTIETGLAEIDEEFIRRYGYGKTGAYALITVSDTGHGMDETTRQRVFDPFFTTKEVGKGTGLGLAMVYGSVKQHNGYINVFSESGKGAAFKIYLPVLPVPARSLPEAAPAAYPRGGSELILLAEDDRAVRNLARSVLQEFGYAVIEAADGREALEKLEQYRDRIDLLIIDIVMPGMNGKEVYEEAERMKPGIKVLFTSGYPADVVQRQDGLETGMPFISKPAAPRDLLRKIREVLDR